MFVVCVVCKEEVNVWTEQAISEWASRNNHRILKKDGKLMKRGQVLPSVSQIEAVEKFEKFIEGAEYLIAHGKVDFETIRYLLDKTRESPIYEDIQKVDSQKFFKSILWGENRESKYGMATIVKYYGDERTKAAHKYGAHGALVDVENLCAVSTGGQLMNRFKDWLMFERSEESEVPVMFSRQARSQSIPPPVRFYPG